MSTKEKIPHDTKTQAEVVGNRAAESVMVDLQDVFGANWSLNNLPVEAVNGFEHYHYFYKAKSRPPPLHEDILEKPAPAIIIGTGWSTDLCLHLLKNWQGAIFCSTSHIRALVRMGAYPTYMVAVDPKEGMSEWIMPKKDMQHIIDSQCTTFVFPPTAPITFTRAWKGRKRIVLVADPTKEWYGQILRPAFPWITDMLIPFTSNYSALIALAHFLNYAPLYCVGGDFAGEAMTAYHWVPGGKWHVSRPRGMYIAPEVQVRTYHGLIANPNLLWAWRGYLLTLRIDSGPRQGVRWHVYNCGKGNAMQDSLPYADIVKVIKNQGRGQRMPWTRSKAKFRLDVALAHFHTYVMEVHSGINRGGRPHIATSYKQLVEQIDNLNASLKEARKIGLSVPKEALKQIPGGFDPNLIQGIDKKTYLPYIKEVMAAAKLDVKKLAAKDKPVTERLKGFGAVRVNQPPLTEVLLSPDQVKQKEKERLKKMSPAERQDEIDNQKKKEETGIAPKEEKK